ncbi:MAG: thioredoxin domain-containing protein [bacterium]|nr:thioredoxin domain-containing protein [bacterium]MDZ4285049.1 thioredoxin domain-containing protein [Patescibacteria group bacterium]
MPRSLTIPTAIILAGVFIGGAVFFSNKASRPAAVVENVGESATAPKQQGAAPISGDDHILGNPQAPIILIEYSDTECPFCKNYHATLHRIMDEYGKMGAVAWVYRHFPLAAVHSKSPKEAEATECAAELGGNSGFWLYLDRIFTITPSDNKLDPALLATIAADIGLDRAEFERCLKSGKYAKKVEAMVADAERAGATGTPHTVVLVAGNQLPLEGAQPYSSIRSLIESILQNVPQAGSETEASVQ